MDPRDDNDPPDQNAHAETNPPKNTRQKTPAEKHAPKHARRNTRAETHTPKTTRRRACIAAAPSIHPGIPPVRIHRPHVRSSLITTQPTPFADFCSNNLFSCVQSFVE
jgi:hypothetical protein